MARSLRREGPGAVVVEVAVWLLTMRACRVLASSTMVKISQHLSVCSCEWCLFGEDFRCVSVCVCCDITLGGIKIG